jgi:UDP-GlcNAc:undecaprenyl-phosphate GlcNAc-1-phosphate transferase
MRESAGGETGGNVNYLLVMVGAMAVSVLMVPVLARLAPRLGLMDAPAQRKVHQRPVPRVGGIAVVCGALISIGAFGDIDPLLRGYLIGSGVIFVFGLWDDAAEIGHYWKFLGQFLAVVPVVGAGLYVTNLPFVGEPVGMAIGIPFTVIAMVGMINAVNHSDGLDGLAGGEVLVSLAGIAVLAYLSEAWRTLVIVSGALGGVLGFLRYNSYPARIFMGDSGSQFLGLSVAFLLVMMTQQGATELTPSVVLLLAGLPVADILIVLYKRVSGGMNWFRATRNHLHHRLLDIGFSHVETVIIIYSVQAALVSSGILLAHGPDWLLVGIYLLTIAGTFGAVTLAERRGWRRLHQDRAEHRVLGTGWSRLLVVVPRRFLEVVIPAYLAGTSLFVTDISPWTGRAAAVMSALLMMVYLFVRRAHSLIHRAILYLTVGVIAFEAGLHMTLRGWGEIAESTLFVLLLVSVVVAVVFSPGRRKVEFRPTSTDYLTVLILFAGLIISGGALLQEQNTRLIVEMLILFYGIELIMTERRERWHALSTATLGSAMILALRTTF